MLLRALATPILDVRLVAARESSALPGGATGRTVGALLLRAFGDANGLRTTLAPQQHVERAGAPVTRARGRECQHRLGDAAMGEPGLELLFQNRRAVLGVEPTPMDDQHASPAGTEAVQDEALDGIVRLCRGQAVQVEMSLPREVASSQPADHPRIEPYDKTLNVLARIRDVEARDPGHQVGERGQRLRFLAHRSR